jgi:hypothetical protein
VRGWEKSFRLITAQKREMVNAEWLLVSYGMLRKVELLLSTTAGVAAADLELENRDHHASRKVQISNHILRSTSEPDVIVTFNCHMRFTWSPITGSVNESRPSSRLIRSLLQHHYGLYREWPAAIKNFLRSTPTTNSTDRPPQLPNQVQPQQKYV